MILFIDNSDIMGVTSGVLYHGCNAQGVMGSGVAKQVKAQYPEAYSDYLELLEQCSALEISALGKVAVTRATKDLYVASAITQEFYGRDGKRYVDYDAIKRSLVTVAFSHPDKIIHIPHMVGAGLGGGDYATIKTLIEDVSDGLGFQVYCHIKY